jgi:hypothetical protein
MHLSDLNIVELYRNLFLRLDYWAGVLTINRLQVEPDL